MTPAVRAYLNQEGHVQFGLIRTALLIFLGVVVLEVLVFSEVMSNLPPIVAVTFIPVLVVIGYVIWEWLQIKRDRGANVFFRTRGRLTLGKVKRPWYRVMPRVNLRVGDRKFVMHGQAAVYASRTADWGTIDFVPHSRRVLALRSDAGRVLYLAPGYVTDDDPDPGPSMADWDVVRSEPWRRQDPN